MKRLLRASPLLALVHFACSGTVDSQGPGAEPGSKGRPQSGGAGSSGGPGMTGGNGMTGQPGPTGGTGMGVGTTPVGTFQPAPARLRRLTVAQYRNSVRDLLGNGVTLPTDLQGDDVVEGLAAIGTTASAISSRTTEALEAGALALAGQALSDPKSRDALVGCDAAAPTCLRTFLERFGKRVWRRPLVAEELDRYTAAGKAEATRLGDPWKGVQLVVAALLQSPYFLYRVELGQPDGAKPGRLRLTDYELATRLSYLLSDTTPDAALLDAAAAGQLQRPGGLTMHAERLLASPRLSQMARAFVGDMLGLGALDSLEQSAALFPMVTATLGPSMREEILRSLEDLTITQAADWRDVYTTRTTFLNKELGDIYKVPVTGSGFTKTMLPDSAGRAGILGQAGFLAMNAHPTETSPTRRGKFIRESMLCQGVPPPPPNANTTLPDAPKGKTLTMKQRLEIHRNNPACASCHGLMDPVGLGLENYDPVGAFRTTDGGLPIDASGDLDGVPFRDALALGAALHAHPQAGPCFVRTMYRYALGHLETPGEEALVASLISGSERASYRVRPLLTALVESDAFQLVSPSP